MGALKSLYEHQELSSEVSYIMIEALALLAADAQNES